MRRQRGFSLLTVAVVLAILSILLQAGLTLLDAQVKETRWRADSRYAEELARSGVDWAKACLALESGGCSTSLEARGGTIRVEVEGGPDVFDIRSSGRVVVEGTVRAERVEEARYRPPERPVDPSVEPPREPAPPAGEPPTDPAGGGGSVSELERR